MLDCFPNLQVHSFGISTGLCTFLIFFLIVSSAFFGGEGANLFELQLIISVKQVDLFVHKGSAFNTIF